MIYYDRRLPEDLRRLFRATGALSWLVEWVRQAPLARMDFRREDNERQHGGVQIYFGRTSPLEVLGQLKGRIKIAADDEYRAVTPDLFGAHRVEALPELEPRIRQHLDACRTRVTSSFVDGEAIAHNGMMRRYGLGFGSSDPMIAVDSEVVLGFRADDVYPTGSAHREAHYAEARAAVGVPENQALPRKLDALAILPEGNIALVEVKDCRGDLVRAAWQAAVHVFNFGRLTAQWGYDLSAVINGMVDEKTDLGLLPQGAPRAVSQPRIFPVVAAPEDRPGWRERWMTKVQPIMDSTRFLTGLRLWRLAPDGEIEEEHRP